jgi:ubiquinone biosynthesis protein
LGMVVQSDYLHLSRSFAAMAGTYLNMYEGVPKAKMLTDALKDIALFPVNLTRDRIRRRVDSFQQYLPFLG